MLISINCLNILLRKYPNSLDSMFRLNVNVIFRFQWYSTTNLWEKTQMDSRVMIWYTNESCLHRLNDMGSNHKYSESFSQNLTEFRHSLEIWKENVKKNACLIQTQVLLCGSINLQFNIRFVLNPRSHSVRGPWWLKKCVLSC